MSVTVLGRHDEIVGKWISTNDLQNDGRQSPDLTDKSEPINPVSEEKVIDKPKEMADNRKEIADEIVRQVMSKDSTDNAIPDISHLSFKGEPDVIAAPESLAEKFREINESVGTCDICSQPSQELWEHEEEGISKNVCRNCFAVRFAGGSGNGTHEEKFERFLKTKRKVVLGADSMSLGIKPVLFKESAKFSDFTPIPKPVKKEKKS